MTVPIAPHSPACRFSRRRGGLCRWMRGLAWMAGQSTRQTLKSCAHGRPGAVRFGAALLVGLLLCTAQAVAGSHDRQRDHEAAREAFLAGEILPLRTVLDRVARDFPGRVVRIGFESRNKAYAYDVKLIQPTGTIVKLKVDARTGDVIEFRARGLERRGKPADRAARHGRAARPDISKETD